MIIDAKILHKILAKQIQQYIKRSYTMIKLDIFHRFKDASVSTNQSTWYICINKTKDKKHMTISTDTEKTFEKIQQPSVIQTLNKVGMERT